MNHSPKTFRDYHPVTQFVIIAVGVAVTVVAGLIATGNLNL